MSQRIWIYARSRHLRPWFLIPVILLDTRRCNRWLHHWYLLLHRAWQDSSDYWKCWMCQLIRIDTSCDFRSRKLRLLLDYLGLYRDYLWFGNHCWLRNDNWFRGPVNLYFMLMITFIAFTFFLIFMWHMSLQIFNFLLKLFLLLF